MHAAPFQPLADAQPQEHEEGASDESIVSSTPSTATGTDTEEHDPAPEAESPDMPAVPDDLSN